MFYQFVLAKNSHNKSPFLYDFILKFAEKQQLMEEHLGEDIALSRNYYWWVVVTQIIAYLIVTDYYWSYLPKNVLSFATTASAVHPFLYLVYEIRSKASLGWEKRDKSKRYLSPKILVWMKVICILLLWVGFVVVGLNSDDIIAIISYIVLFVVNMLLSVFILLGRFEERQK